MIYYRYEDVQYAPPYDEFDNPRGKGRLAVELREFAVAKVTKCGVRLDTGRFVNANYTKQYARPTKELALTAFIARKTRQLQIHQSRVYRAHYAISLAQLGRI